MSALIDRLVKRNPLLGYGPRAHRTGIALIEDAPTARRRRRPLDVDAPRVHLGREHRSAA